MNTALILLTIAGRHKLGHYTAGQYEVLHHLHSHQTNAGMTLTAHHRIIIHGVFSDSNPNLN